MQPLLFFVSIQCHEHLPAAVDKIGLFCCKIRLFRCSMRVCCLCVVPQIPSPLPLLFRFLCSCPLVSPLGRPCRHPAPLLIHPLIVTSVLSPPHPTSPRSPPSAHLSFLHRHHTGGKSLNQRSCSHSRRLSSSLTTIRPLSSCSALLRSENMPR